MECGTPTAADPGAPRATPAEPTGTASRRTTSLLFGDLVGFTTLSESRDAEDVRELLGRYFDECRRIVARYGGTIEKFIGDAVMAVWGVPTAHEDDAERAVRAGLELVAAVNDFGHDVGAPDLALRVGIVTGEVAVTVGATQQGMVAGDAVNTAARVQSAATPGQVWVDETTRLLTTAAITYADAGSHALKGKVDPVPLWSVRAVVAAVGGAQRADGLEAPLVGRDRELRLIKELFHQTQESGRPTLLVVDGDPGVGKTRLGWEFEKYTDGINDPLRWHSGRCVAYGEGVAYFALAEAVRGRIQIGADVSGETGEEVGDLSPDAQLERALARHVPDAEERDWLRGRMAALLGTGSGTGTGSGMATYAREDLFSAWTVFLQRVAGDEPLTLVVDDAQHADDGLLAFLEHLVSTATFSCFVVLLTRPGLLERAGSLASHRRTNLLRLATLTDLDMARLLDGLVVGLPDEVRDQLVARSDGIPVFAVETVRSLIDRDLVVPRGGQYVLADDAPLDLDSLAAPASLQALIAARLDALTPDQRRVVDRASVLGTTFTLDALAALCPEVADVGSVLRDLQRVQIFAHDSNRMSSTYGQHSFVQSAVRQVAYGVLSRRDRKAVHLAVVAHFEHAGETGDDTAAIRAQHYLDALAAVPGDHDEAELRAAAVDNLVRAAARSTGLGSHQEAARHLATASPLVHGDARRAPMLLQQATAEFEAGLWQSSLAHAHEAEELFVTLGDRRRAGHAAGVRGQVLVTGLRQAEEAITLTMPWWEELCEDQDAVEARLILSRVLMGSEFRGPNPERGLQMAHERLRLAEEQEDTEAVITTLSSLSAFYSDRGLMTISNSLLVTASELARDAHDPASEAATLVNLIAAANPTDVAAALRNAEYGLEVASRAGNRYNLEFIVANSVIALWNGGRWDDMEAPLELLESRFGPTTDEYAVGVRALRNRARGLPVPPIGELSADGGDDPSLLAWGRVLRGLEGTPPVADLRAPALAATHAFHDFTGVWDDLHFVHAHAMTVALEAGDEAASRELLEQVSGARRLPRSLRGHRDLLRAWLAGRAVDVGAHGGASEHGGAGDPGELFGAAVEHYEVFGSPVYVAHAHRWWADWLLSQGRPDEAAPHLTAARATYERLGATAWLADASVGRAGRAATVVETSDQTTSLRP
ncbi:adenylate/guanylate cyclase domain-containing protein [Nocardioides sp.]|uniref:adenylate/guanylate cyclase domain-containing protein n=1 Tax=Nocardioides sp. TaxID=35761 RepID=UPI00286ADB26|nr:adenylate/guanylate cyclase domain-containing protein [Nocardioides sp.]